MARKFSIYWYNKIPDIGRAGLWNLRNDDLRAGGQILAGQLIRGAVGYAAAESTVAGWTAKTVRFRADRRCEWQGFELPCMVHSETPPGTTNPDALRDYNYIVARVINEKVASAARKLRLLYVVTPTGVPVLTLEISRFPRQNPARSATLLP